MKNCLYVLLCNNGRYYIGSCVDLESRIAAHKRGNTKSTKNFRPLTLVFYQSFNSLSSARKAEYWFKKQKSQTFIERVIKEGALSKKFD